MPAPGMGPRGNTATRKPSEDKPKKAKAKYGYKSPTSIKGGRGASVTNVNAGSLKPRAVPPPTPSDSELIKRKLGGDASKANILAWQKRYNQGKSAGEKIKEDGIAGEQTRTAMGVRSYMPSRNQMRAQGAGEGTAPTVTAKSRENGRNTQYDNASWNLAERAHGGSPDQYANDSFLGEWAKRSWNDIKRYVPWAIGGGRPNPLRSVPKPGAAALPPGRPAAPQGLPSGGPKPSAGPTGAKAPSGGAKTGSAKPPGGGGGPKGQQAPPKPPPKPPPKTEPPPRTPPKNEKPPPKNEAPKNEPPPRENQRRWQEEQARRDQQRRQNQQRNQQRQTRANPPKTEPPKEGRTAFDPRVYRSLEGQARQGKLKLQDVIDAMNDNKISGQQVKNLRQILRDAQRGFQREARGKAPGAEAPKPPPKEAPKPPPRTEPPKAEAPPKPPPKAEQKPPPPKEEAPKPPPKAKAEPPKAERPRAYQDQSKAEDIAAAKAARAKPTGGRPSFETLAEQAKKGDLKSEDIAEAAWNKTITRDQAAELRAMRDQARTPPPKPKAKPKPKATPPKAETPKAETAPPKTPKKPRKATSPSKVTPELRNLANKATGANRPLGSMPEKAGVRMKYQAGGKDVEGHVWSAGPEPGTIWVARSDGRTFDLLGKYKGQGAWTYRRTWKP